MNFRRYRRRPRAMIELPPNRYGNPQVGRGDVLGACGDFTFVELSPGVRVRQGGMSEVWHWAWVRSEQIIGLEWPE